MEPKVFLDYYDPAHEERSHQYQFTVGNHIKKIVGGKIIKEEYSFVEITDRFIFQLFAPYKPPFDGKLRPSQSPDFLDYQFTFHESYGGERKAFIFYVKDFVEGFIQMKPSSRKDHPVCRYIYQWLEEKEKELSNHKNDPVIMEDRDFKTIRYRKPKSKSVLSANQIALLSTHLQKRNLISNDLSKTALSNLFSALTGVSEHSIYGRKEGGLTRLHDINDINNLEKVKEELLRIIQDLEQEINNLKH